MSGSAALTPFRRVLIANRGEIALRVQRSAHALGHETVAVYSTADAGAAHTMQADRAVCIGAALPSQSYMNVAALIDAARRSGADAVHPGYGFLAENAAFAQACADAGLVFIGPTVATIAAMGDKAEAKRRMQAVGVPCIPGWHGSNADDAALIGQAARLGYPLMIKATAGGGGRGMRLVESAGDFAAALRSARSEAQHAFGDDTVLIERALVEPRHIEIQILADRYGHVVHTGERDCSVQRRHQKLIEESPSPAVGPALRERMGAAAVAVARAVGYEGAGTIEFLLDRNGDDFWFMEMNTRLQVEHPVTEAVTGLDLVAWQLRIAAGERLDLRQDDVRMRGHAIEVRLCAEDVRQGFLPQSGTLLRWRPSCELRVEHALGDESEIAPYYDSMIAKFVAHGASRDEARRKLRRGLAASVVFGVVTNRDFLLRCLDHADFARGAATTAFVARHLEALVGPDEAMRTRLLALAALLLTACSAAGTAAAAVLQPRFEMPMLLRVADADIAVSVSARGPGSCTARVGATAHEMRLLEVGPLRVRFECDGVAESAAWHRDGADLWLDLAGTTLRIEDRSRVAALRAAVGGRSDGRVRAGTGGRVVAVLVAVGERVVAGQALLTLEAMKMEHAQAAPAAGTVSAIHARVGEQAAAGALLAEMTVDAPATAAEGSPQ